MRTPCKGCEDRKVGCHSNCERYAECRAAIESGEAEKKRKIIMNEWSMDKARKSAKVRDSLKK